MVRIGAVFIAVCMMLIAGSIGAALYMRFGFSIANAALVALGVLTVLATYNAVAGRRRDRAEVNNQVSNLARGSGDLARQVAEFDRRLGIIESRVETALGKALSTAQPLATEIEELSRLVRQLAETVAEHDTALGHGRTRTQEAARDVGDALAAATSAANAVVAAAATETPAGKVTAFSGLKREAIVEMVRNAIEAQRIDLYLQPIVTLPQRKVRYYEALSRFNAGNGEVVAAGDFLPYAVTGGLLPKLDALSVLRCVQVVRRLLLKNRDVGLFCNLAVASLTDPSFRQLLDFLEANRAIASSLVFEFTQSAFRAMGPIEHESLAAIAERGFRFSMDNLSDLRVEPRELTERGFRFIKAPAALLLNRVGAAANIHPADFSDLLGRFGIDLIAERIESEATVVDLLDYDVRFGQGFLFSPPRPVRAEALQGAGDKGEPSKMEAAIAGTAGEDAPPTRGGVLAQLVRAGFNRS